MLVLTAASSPPRPSLAAGCLAAGASEAMHPSNACWMPFLHEFMCGALSCVALVGCDERLTDRRAPRHNGRGFDTSASVLLTPPPYPHTSTQSIDIGCSMAAANDAGGRQPPQPQQPNQSGATPSTSPPPAPHHPVRDTLYTSRPPFPLPFYKYVRACDCGCWVGAWLGIDPPSALYLSDRPPLTHPSIPRR